MTEHEQPGALPSDEAILQWLADQVGLAIVRKDGGPEAHEDVALAGAAITRLRELLAAMEQIAAPNPCIGKPVCERATIARGVLRTPLLRAHVN